MPSGTTFSADRAPIDEIEPVDAVVVFGLDLDVHFLEPGHRPVGGRLQDADVGRTILERADEVLRLARRGDAVGIGERDAIELSASRSERPGEFGRRRGAQREAVAAAERHQPGRGRPIGEHVHADVGAARRVDVAAVRLGARRQLQAGGIGVIDVDARDARRRMHDRDTS